MGDQTHVSTRILGTYGYAAPEYVMTGHLTARSDVYGYGVVFLEMPIGKKTMDRSRPTQEHNLVEFARPLLIHNKKLRKIIDPRMDGQYSARSIRKVANLAYHCLSLNPKGRPTMTHVVETLEVIQNIQESETEDVMNFDKNCGSGEHVYEVRRVKSDRGSFRERQQKREWKLNQHLKL